MAGFNAAATAGNLPGYLQPQYGLLSGLAQGAQSFLQAYQAGHKQQIDEQQLALQNQMTKNLYNLKLREMGLKQGADPGSPFTLDEDAIRLKMINQQIEQRQKNESEVDAMLAKNIGEGGDVEPNSKQLILDKINSGLLTNGLVSPAAPAGQSIAPDLSQTNAIPSATSGIPSDRTIQGGPAIAPQQPGTAPTAPAPIASPAASTGGMIKAKPNAFGITPSPARQKLLNDLAAQAQDVQIKKADLAGKNLDNQKKMKENNDVFNRAPQLNQESAKTINAEDIKNRSIFQKLAEAKKILDNPKVSPMLKFERGIQVVNELKDQEGAGGFRGKQYDDAVNMLKNARGIGEAGPFVGRQFEAFSQAIGNKLNAIKSSHKENQQDIAKLIPGYKPLNLLPATHAPGDVITLTNGTKFKIGDDSETMEPIKQGPLQK